jgi:hypothetical protein
MYTNNTGIPLAVAVWLAHDDYDHRVDPNTISATSLLKPIKQLILARRVPKEDGVEDISGLVASRMGTAIHNEIEKVWLNNYKSSMDKLGYPIKVIEKIRINPTSGDLQEAYDMDEGIIPVYMEIRTDKKVGNFTITGKFDFVSEGRVQDFKSTSTYTYVNKTNDEKYILQGSLYRWLNPELITDDYMDVHFIFTNWMPSQVASNPNYPPNKVMAYPLELLSLHETEAYVNTKLMALTSQMYDLEEDLPECTDEDLWRTDPVWKYYKNPAKTTRSTKNFTDSYSAAERLVKDGSVGLVVEVKGEVRACKYCPAFSVCKQKNVYLLDGSLKGVEGAI